MDNTIESIWEDHRGLLVAREGRCADRDKDDCKLVFSGWV